MSDEITVRFPATILEALRCFICRGYLSCSPVLLLPNSNYICGRCAPLNTDTPTHRLIPLETLLNSMSFPCTFKKYGCREILLFGKTVDHESQCVHKPLGCPTRTSTTCAWEGTVIQIFQHFKDYHLDCVKNKFEFQLELTQDAQGFLISSENSIPFIVKYFYSAKGTMLKYDVRYCGNKREHEVSCKLQLINAADSECNINLKMKECLCYDESFYTIQNSNGLDLSKFVDNLGDPDFIIVALKLKIIKSATIEEFHTIKTLKCDVCHNYLISPLYELKGKVICCYCFKTKPQYKKIGNLDILKRVNQAMYPCRWPGCNYVGKSYTFKDHEMNCEFRILSCIYSNCAAQFNFSAVAKHLQTHANKSRIAVYMPNKITYKISFILEFIRKDILTIRNQKAILLWYSMVKETEFVHKLNVCQSIDDSVNDISGNVYIAHEHCKLTSKQFCVQSNKHLKITLKDLPPCFKETDELTVTVELL